MIKFFRRIRQHYLKENRVGKYLLYAIGEIILVVIGILIALYLNNLNQISQSNAKIDTLMGEVLLDLESNINLTNYLLRFYSDKDSLYGLVLNDQVTFEDYASDSIGGDLNILTTWYAGGQMKQSAYDNLLGELNSIPEEYTSIMSKLKGLNSGEKKSYNKYSDLVEDMSNRNIQKRADEYEWYSNPLKKVDRINFMLNDYHYKNEVVHYATITTFYVEYITDYNSLARRCYKEIATLLNRPIDTRLKNFPEVAKSLVGTWQSEQVPGTTVVQFIEDDKLFFKNNFDSNKDEIIIFSNTKYITDDFCTIMKEGDDIVIKVNDGSVWRKVKE